MGEGLVWNADVADLGSGNKRVAGRKGY